MSDLPPPPPPIPAPPPLPGGAPERPPPATWGPLETVPVFVMAVLFGAVVTAAVMATTAGCGAYTVLGFAAEEVGFVACVILWVKYVHHESLQALGLPRR